MGPQIDISYAAIIFWRSQLKKKNRSDFHLLIGMRLIVQSKLMDVGSDLKKASWALTIYMRTVGINIKNATDYIAHLAQTSVNAVAENGTGAPSAARILVPVDVSKASTQAQGLIESSIKGTFESTFDKVPSSISDVQGEAVGLFIAHEYRYKFKSEIRSSPSAAAKRSVIERYWQKSLSKEMKSDVKVELLKSK